MPVKQKEIASVFIKMHNLRILYVIFLEWFKLDTACPAYFPEEILFGTSALSKSLFVQSKAQES